MSIETLQRTFETAVAQHQAGRLGEAEAGYRQILQQQPNHPGALHLLGVLAAQVKRFDVAESLIRQSISVKPDFAIAYGNLGYVLMQTNRDAEAVEICRRGTNLDPTSAQIWGNLGDALNKTGKVDEAIAAYDRSLALLPHNPLVLNSLATSLFRKNRVEEAIVAAQRAVQQDPKFIDAYFNAGHFMTLTGRVEEAINTFRQAVVIAPNRADTHLNLGAALSTARRPEDALACYWRSLELDPNLAAAHNNIANILTEAGRSEEAVKHLNRALTFDPNYTAALNNLANALNWLGRLEEAVEAYDRAINLKADYVEAYCNRAITLLRLGRLIPAWEDYEHRIKNPNLEITRRGLDLPKWEGEDLTGKTILLKSEQGLGDTLQFIRYAPMLKERGARIVLEGHTFLKTLLLRHPSIDQFVDDKDPLPHLDCFTAMLSLPRIFKTSLENIPVDIPYLEPDPSKVAYWRGELARFDGSYRIGLCWAGRPTYKLDHFRSTTLTTLEPLARIAGVTFVSLQKGQAAVQVGTYSQSLHLFDRTSELKDFDDTAALITNLDLVITVDTAVAHLAAAMGKPTWILLPYSNDWRWLLERDDSPWYPSVRLFRQERNGDWTPVMKQVVELLAATVARELHRSNPVSENGRSSIGQGVPGMELAR